MLVAVTTRTVKEVISWVIAYVGNIQLDPAKELLAIPDHSSFFILAKDNKWVELVGGASV